jgi:hypothetical protein
MVKPHEQVEFSFPTKNVCSQDHLMLHSVVLFSMALCFPRIALSFLNVKQYALWRNCGQEKLHCSRLRKEEYGMKLKELSYYSSSCGRPAIGFRS